MFIGQTTCLASYIGAYLLKVSSSNGDILRSKLLSFTSEELLSSQLFDVDSENNVQVIMGRLSFFALLKFTNTLDLERVKTSSRAQGAVNGAGNTIRHFQGSLYILGRVSDLAGGKVELFFKADLHLKLLNSCYQLNDVTNNLGDIEIGDIVFTATDPIAPMIGFSSTIYAVASITSVDSALV